MMTFAHPQLFNFLKIIKCDLLKVWQYNLMVIQICIKSYLTLGQAHRTPIFAHKTFEKPVKETTKLLICAIQDVYAGSVHQ